MAAYQGALSSRNAKCRTAPPKSAVPSALWKSDNMGRSKALTVGSAFAAKYATFNWKIKQLMFLCPATYAKLRVFLLQKPLILIMCCLLCSWNKSRLSPISILSAISSSHPRSNKVYAQVFHFLLTVQTAEHANDVLSCYVLTPDKPSVAAAFGFVAFVIELRE